MMKAKIPIIYPQFTKTYPSQAVLLVSVFVLVHIMMEFIMSYIFVPVEMIAYGYLNYPHTRGLWVLLLITLIGKYVAITFYMMICLGIRTFNQATQIVFSIVGAAGGLVQIIFGTILSIRVAPGFTKKGWPSYWVSPFSWDYYSIVVLGLVEFSFTLVILITSCMKENNYSYEMLPISQENTFDIEKSLPIQSYQNLKGNN